MKMKGLGWFVTQAPHPLFQRQDKIGIRPPAASLSPYGLKVQWIGLGRSALFGGGARVRSAPAGHARLFRELEPLV